MKKLCLLVIAMIVLQSCAHDLSSPEARSRFVYTTLAEGGILEWDEENIDSTVLPSSASSWTASEKEELINKQVATYHVKVTVPDSSIKQLHIERTVTAISARDSNANDATEVWRTVTYGSDYEEYDKNGNLIRTATLPGTDTADIYSFPLLYTALAPFSDSIRSLFIDMLEDAGHTVTNLGNAGIKDESTIAEGGTTFTVIIYYNKDYLTPDSTLIYDGLTLLSTETNSYSAVGAFRISTEEVLFKSLSAPNARRTEFATDFPTINFAEYYDFQTRRITRISNIQLP